MAEKENAIYSYTADSLASIKGNGVKVGMVQIGNETTGGICGEFEKENIYSLMKSAAKAVRDHNKDIQIAVHYTNPEKNLEQVGQAHMQVHMIQRMQESTMVHQTV